MPMVNSLQYIILTALFYGFCLKLYSRYRTPLLNPLMLSILGLLALCASGIVRYADFKTGTTAISYFLGPATVVLAVPMYRQLDAFKTHAIAILAGTLISVPFSMLSILALAKLTHLPPELLLSLAPKSITTPIGISLSEAIGGIPAITVASIVMTGILGAIVSPAIIKLFGIKHPVAQGIAIGSSSHVLGTTTAMTMSELIGAMSSLSIALTGILTYLILPILLAGLRILGWL